MLGERVVSENSLFCDVGCHWTGTPTTPARLHVSQKRLRSCFQTSSRATVLQFNYARNETLRQTRRKGLARFHVAPLREFFMSERDNKNLAVSRSYRVRLLMNVLLQFTLGCLELNCDLWILNGLVSSEKFHCRWKAPVSTNANETLSLASWFNLSQWEKSISDQIHTYTNHEFLCVWSHQWDVKM